MRRQTNLALLLAMVGLPQDGAEICVAPRRHRPAGSPPRATSAICAPTINIEVRPQPVPPTRQQRRKAARDAERRSRRNAKTRKP